MNESDYKQDNFELILYQTETNIFKAPTGSTDPFECKQVKVADVLTYKTELAKKYRHLLLAPGAPSRPEPATTVTPRAPSSPSFRSATAR